MLTRRTNLLLSEEDYAILQSLSREKNKTMGELVRHAVKKTYKTKTKRNVGIGVELEARIKKGWKFLKHPEIPVDYKAWIENGRKY